MDDIFELAKAKKLFGGGGGKRTGTAIPVGQPVDRIFFNLANTTEETNAILSQLTFVQTPLLQYPLYAVYANTDNGNTGNFIVVIQLGDGKYAISIINNIASSISNEIFNGAWDNGDLICNGWWAVVADSRVYYPSGAPIYDEGMTLTDFNGIPVGAENEKIKNVLSITPF